MLNWIAPWGSKFKLTFYFFFPLPLIMEGLEHGKTESPSGGNETQWRKVLRVGMIKRAKRPRQNPVIMMLGVFKQAARESWNFRETEDLSIWRWTKIGQLSKTAEEKGQEHYNQSLKRVWSPNMIYLLPFLKKRSSLSISCVTVFC